MSKKSVTESPTSPFVMSGTSPPHSDELSNFQNKDKNLTETEFFEKFIGTRSTQDIWFSTAEAANYLRIPEGTLRNMTSNGRITHYKLGRLNRYLEADLKKLLLSQKRGE